MQKQYLIDKKKDKIKSLTKRQKLLLKSKTKKPKILHIGTGTTLQTLYRDSQREDGYVSDVLYHSLIRKKSDYDMDLSIGYEFSLIHNVKSAILNILNGNFFDMLRYDIYHIHHDAFLLPSRKDIFWLKKYLKKKVLLHWHGEGVRKHGFHRLPWLRNLKQVCSTPDLLEYQEFEGQFEWLPRSIDIKKFDKLKKKKPKPGGILTIIHPCAATNRRIKGTEKVLKVIGELKREGYRFNFILNEDLSYEKTIENYAKSDICIDWVNPSYGIYGVVSIENMAIGNVACACVRQKYMDRYYKGCPVVNVNPKNLKERLIKLIENKRLRAELGKRGVEYVRGMHDNRKVMKRLYKIYEEC